MQLIIDAGNTSIKFVLIDSGKIVKTVISPKNELKRVNLSLLKKFSLEKVYLGSVVPSLNKKIIKIIQNQLGMETEIILPIDFSKHLDLKNFNLQTQGVDIIGFAYYIAKNFTSGVGISFGTATFIVFVNNEQLMGTSILPGILSGIDVLNSTTELISTDGFLKNKGSLEKAYYGNDTATALFGGAQVFALGTVVASKKIYKDMFFETPKIIISGGKSYWLNGNDTDMIKIENIVALGYYALKN